MSPSVLIILIFIAVIFFSILIAVYYDLHYLGYSVVHSDRFFEEYNEIGTYGLMIVQAASFKSPHFVPGQEIK